MAEKPLVQNAGDPKQVNAAGLKVKFNREQELNDLRWVLSDPRGRRVIWGLMTFCKVFASVWEASARIHYMSGQQDVGHKIMADVVEANDDSLIQMMRESKEREIKNG